MKIKEGVSLAGLDIRMQTALVVADSIWTEYGQELVVTSGLEGTHSAGSLHYYGLALDFRTRYFTGEECKQVYADMQERLCANYRIIYHATHMHVQSRYLHG